MNGSTAIADVQARGMGPEASGEDFRSETRLYPLAPRLARAPTHPSPIVWGRDGWGTDEPS